MRAWYGLMMALDYWKARQNDRAMQTGVKDAVILSGRVRPPSPPPNGTPAQSGPGGTTGKLVRLYGRSRGGDIHRRVFP